MRIYNWNQLSRDEQRILLKRPASSSSAELQSGTREILADVHERGDQALIEMTARFDKVELQSLRVPPPKIQAALENLEPITREALEMARDNIERFHRQQLPRRIEIPTLSGIRCFREARPIERVGFYIPGGTAPLPSTVLMLGVPSHIAENPLRILCSPPQADGEINKIVLATAALCGIDQVYRVGGAQAIAAMAFGTDSIPKVDKIFGPGNAWVTEAKQQVASHPEGAAIDMPAGPSEVLVIADDEANPIFVAADLLSQAEHGPDSQVILITTSEGLAKQCLGALDRLLQKLPRREIAAQALMNSRCFVVPDIQTAVEISDTYAPEHLILQIYEPEVWARRLKNAGSVFLGAYSPESAGDYATGTNHVLPTYGHARAWSGLSLESFLKHITFQHLSREGLAAIGPAVEQLARLEGLEAHRLAVSVRLRPEEQ
ncbi:MAG TPA: histidinol dehydrogenase [Oligoflexus sp.]|uniref:histidinol dehydrogenase n=1 Tax=Oligoflexus sp. TaxID=1971216 RepID=UPI002D4DC5FE|nr:histidinol dehydrogenase [Oligoflexus sp.]HYX34000.1 histidinol dehydrogenase [Oligoflexus sp.]